MSSFPSESKPAAERTPGFTGRISRLGAARVGCPLVAQPASGWQARLRLASPPPADRRGAASAPPTSIGNTSAHYAQLEDTPGFTLVEVMVAAALSVFVLAGVLTANLQIIRSGVRITQYAEMETQVRRAFDHLGRDLREAQDFTWNGESDITLTIPTSGATTAQVTYAWTAASQSFFRVAGTSSATMVGRLELVRGISALPDGSAGVKFARLDRDGAAATTNGATKSVSVTMTVTRNAKTVAATSQNAASATFTMRNKPSS